MGSFSLHPELLQYCVQLTPESSQIMSSPLNGKLGISVLSEHPRETISLLIEVKHNCSKRGEIIRNDSTETAYKRVVQRNAQQTPITGLIMC